MTERAFPREENIYKNSSSLNILISAFEGKLMFIQNSKTNNEHRFLDRKGAENISTYNSTSFLSYFLEKVLNL